MTLAIAKNAVDAVERIGNLIANHGSDSAKFSFVVCDTKQVWLVSSGAKLWAAHQVADGFLRITSKGLSVKTTIDKSTDDLGDALQTLGLWNGEVNKFLKNIFNFYSIYLLLSMPFVGRFKFRQLF